MVSIFLAIVVVYSLQVPRHPSNLIIDGNIIDTVANDTISTYGTFKIDEGFVRKMN